jgi:single-stranded-DNA-specific exonuclease
VWRLKETDEAAARELAAGLSVSVSLARVLVARGYRSRELAERFLNPRITDLHPVDDLPDIIPAVERIRLAIREKQPILIWGHEDLDGMSATVVLAQTIHDLHGITGHYLPAKGAERHGLNPSKLREFHQQGFRLVITVDCGITNLVETEEARKLGMDIVITDHHEPLDRLPAASAVVNPKREDNRYPFSELAGVGVALKTAYALVRTAVGVSLDQFFSARPELLTIAALGTIADRVPLVDENRVLVRFGLAQMRQTHLPAVQVVLAAGGIRPEDLTVQRFVLDLLPLFSSADGNAGVEMLMGAPLEAAREWSYGLVRQYQSWREDARVSYEAAERFLELAPGILLVRSDELSLRALGHCASRLKDQYLLPAIVMGRRGDDWVGECRGVEGVNLVDLLRAGSRYLLDYGGHRKACGFTVSDNRVDAFTAAAKDYAARNFLGKITESREPVADAVVPLDEITDDFRKLSPLGEGNPQPVLVAMNTVLQRQGSVVTSAAAPHLRLIGDEDIMPGHYDVLYSLDDNLNVHLEQLESTGTLTIHR